MWALVGGWLSWGVGKTISCAIYDDSHHEGGIHDRQRGNDCVCLPPTTGGGEGPAWLSRADTDGLEIEILFLRKKKKE